MLLPLHSPVLTKELTDVVLFAAVACRCPPRCPIIAVMGHSLPPQAPEASAPAALAAADAERVRKALASALAENTRRAYLGHWAAFGAWCAASGYAPAPAAPQTVAAHRAAVRTDRVGGKGPRARAGRHRPLLGSFLCRAAALGGRGAGVGRRGGLRRRQRAARHPPEQDRSGPRARTGETWCRTRHGHRLRDTAPTVRRRRVSTSGPDRREKQPPTCRTAALSTLRRRLCGRGVGVRRRNDRSGTGASRASSPYHERGTGLGCAAPVEILHTRRW